MKYIFWQNIISPHQVDTLNSLANKHEVLLVVEDEIDSQRRKQHWSTDTPPNVKLVVNPSFYNTIKICYENRMHTHFLSGLFSYKMPSIVLFLSYLFKNKIYIISEAVEHDSFKGLIKLFIRRFFLKPFKRNVFGIFATGKYAKKYFFKLGISLDKIHDYGYFVNVKSSIKKRPNNGKNLIYVGRLLEYKGIECLLNTFLKLLSIDNSYTLTIVGSGPLEKKLKKITCDSFIDESQVLFVNDSARSEVLKMIELSDLLLLPNLSPEGWGVVINEALLLGTPVICSKYTGSNVIVDKEHQGVVLNEISEITLIDAIFKMKNYDRNKIAEIAHSKISPLMVSKYIDCVVNNDTNISKLWN